MQITELGKYKMRNGHVAEVTKIYDIDTVTTIYHVLGHYIEDNGDMGAETVWTRDGLLYAGDTDEGDLVELLPHAIEPIHAPEAVNDAVVTTEPASEEQPGNTEQADHKPGGKTLFKIKKPPLGVRPKHIADYERATELLDGILRYAQDEVRPPVKWFEELRGLIQSLARDHD